MRRQPRRELFGKVQIDIEGCAQPNIRAVGREIGLIAQFRAKGYIEHFQFKDMKEQSASELKRLLRMRR